MSLDLIPFEDATNLPANLVVADDEFGTGLRRGFPVLSIEGKVFAVVRGGERELMYTRDANGNPTKAPASELDIIVLRAAPGLSKMYYSKAYVQGSKERPDCYSADGKAPAVDAKAPQSRACATCPHNQWGSKINEKGVKSKACTDVKKLAIAPAGSPEDAMLLRIPPSSLKNWDKYVSDLKRRGRNPTNVATKLSFDYEVTHPVMTFTPFAALGPTTLAAVVAMREDDAVQAILDTSMNVVADLEIEADANALPEMETTETPAVEVPAVAVPEKPKAKAKAKPVETLEEVVAKASAPVDIVIEGGDDILADLDNMAELTFDD